MCQGQCLRCEGGGLSCKIITLLEGTYKKEFGRFSAFRVGFKE